MTSTLTIRSMTLIKRLAKGRPDNFQTPSWPVEKLMDYLSQVPFFAPHKDDKAWDPCCGKGSIVSTLRDMGYDAYGSDKEELDFLTGTNTNEFDYIITNPPYSIKDQFLARCYELGKPFALLMPLTAFEGVKRQALYREHGIQVLFLPRRVNFVTPSGKGKGSHFATAWYTWGFNLSQDIEFLL